MVIVKSITILSFLFIFGIVNQVGADSFGRWKNNDYQEKSSGDNKFGVQFLLGSLKVNNKLKLIESIDRLFPLYKIDEGRRRYKFFNPQGVKEIKSLNSNFSPSLSNLYSNSNQYVDEEEPQIICELFQSKLKRKEIFILFHLTFNPKGKQMFLEMRLTPSFDEEVNFFIPF
jgi:hypothetical protein